MADTSKEIKKTTAEIEREEELKAFNADLKLAEFQARIDKGELTQDEKDTFNALRPGYFK